MKQILTLILLTLFIHSASAQRIFTEGVITYDVFTDGNTKSIGQYKVYVKGNYIKRYLKLDNGLENKTIFNGKDGTSATLKIVQGTPYALTLTKSEVEESNKQFEGASYVFEKQKETIANYRVERGKVLYKNGRSASIAITNDLKPEFTHLINMFPRLNGIPLDYEMDSGNSSMRFIATEVEFRNIDNEEFAIPKNYKIVTKKELDGMR